MPEYTLRLDENERARYRMMAERAHDQEAQHWTDAGLVAGARVVDLGCGPGAVLAVMAEVVGPSGSVIGVDGDEDAVAAGTWRGSAMWARSRCTRGPSGCGPRPTPPAVRCAMPV